MYEDLQIINNKGMQGMNLEGHYFAGDFRSVVLNVFESTSFVTTSIILLIISMAFAFCNVLLQWHFTMLGLKNIFIAKLLTMDWLNL